MWQILIYYRRQALAGLTRVPADRSARDAHNHWINNHATLFANNHERIKDLAGHVQVHTTITFNNTVVVDEKTLNLGSEFYLMRREQLALTSS